MTAPIPNGNGGYTWAPMSSREDIYKWLSRFANSQDPLIQKYFNQYILGISQYYNIYLDWLQDVEATNTLAGDSTAQGVAAGYAQSGRTPDATTESMIANSTSRENTSNAQDYSTWQMNNQYLSAGSQLQSLGLSPSGVLQTGGAVGNGVAAADTSKGNAASLAQQAKINRFNQQMGLAKNLISTAGSMASSGIYGAALGAVKHSASAVASTAAHSGYQAIRATKYNGQGNGSLLSGKLADKWSKLPGAY